MNETLEKTLEEPLLSPLPPSYPKQVCAECGISANVLTCLEKYGERPKQLCYSVSTYHKGTCLYCFEEKQVTEPRDFFYPDFKLLTEYKSMKSRE